MRWSHCALIALFATGCTHRKPTARWLLSYDGSWQRSVAGNEFYVRTLEGPPELRCRGGLFSGVVFLGLREAGNGRWFAAWMNSTRSADATLDDWYAYTDTLTAENGPFRRLDAAAASAKRKLSLAVMIPALARGRTTLELGGGGVGVVTASDRERIYGAYIDTLRLRFDRGAFAHLRLDAVYWLDEAVWGPTASGTDEPKPAIVAAHRRGLKVFWIPYYGAGGASRWRELGFDAAWQQPNFFFDSSLSSARLDTAVQRADAAGMGLELELDKRVVTDSASRRRLRESVLALRGARQRDLTVYDGGGALYELFTSSRPELRAAALEVAHFLCQR